LNNLVLSHHTKCVTVLSAYMDFILLVFNFVFVLDIECTVSCFSGKGKKSAWQAWNAHPDVTTAFVELGKCSSEADITANTMSILERFTVVMYDRTSELSDLNSCRRQLFTKKCRSLELLPPTSDAFLLHVKRAVLQGVHVWGQSLQREPQQV